MNHKTYDKKYGISKNISNNQLLTKCKKMLKLAKQWNQQISNYIFQLLHFNINEEIEPIFFISSNSKS